jgi:hypothetical protein
VKTPPTKDDRVEATKTPEKPFKVTLALYMLWLSLGISVTRALVTWWPFGAPGEPGGFLAAVLMVIVALFRGPLWMRHGDILVVPVSAWLYYMIAKGKNWARITLLIWVILETLSLFMCGRAPAFYQTSTPSDLLIEATLFVLQSVLQITAVTLLFGRVSSNWFRAMKDQQRAAKNQSL